MICNKKTIGKNLNIGKNVTIKCNELILGDDVIIEDNTNVFVYGKLEIGNLSTIGKNSIIKGNNVIIGNEFYNDGYLEIGGGGWNNQNANLVIGDRCVTHNNTININSSIMIGDYVGLSPHVDLITHGYWQSKLEGFPFREGMIKIGDYSIIGIRSIVLGNVKIGKHVTVGAGSIVTKNFGDYVVVAGNPARVIHNIFPNRKTQRDKIDMAEAILGEYKKLLEFKNIDNVRLSMDYPIVYIDNASFNLEDKTYDICEHTAITDDFRDFMRRKGIWFFGRRFKSIIGDI